MKQQIEANLLNNKRNFLNDVHYEFVWVFCNGITEESIEKNHFRNFFKTMFISNDTKSIVSDNAKKLFNGGKKDARNRVRPKRRWILIEQLQLL